MYDTLVLGAAFDPPHLGHYQMAREVLRQGLTKKVLLMPCRQHAFAKQMSPVEVRLAMTLMMREKDIEVSRMELEREGVSYSYLTLRQLQTEFPDKKIGWLMGSDLVADFAKWKNYQEILNDHGVWVYPREGSEGIVLLPGMRWIEGVKEIDISSMEAREAVKMGRDWEGMVLPQITEYIRNKGLYARTD